MSKLETLWLGARATVFWFGFALSTMAYGLLSPLLIVVPYLRRYKILVSWSTLNLWWLRLTCGVSYEVRGRENIPQTGAGIVMANHQSTWETLALAQLFSPISWVAKRELLKVPFFGWGLALVKPIAIDRSAGRNAMDQIKAQGKERLDEGIWIVVFPEGTRVLPGVKVGYKVGGAVMAVTTGYPIIPVAHNSGASWPRHSYIKKPGKITVSIGKPVSPQGRNPEELIREVEAWIENERAGMPLSF